MLVYRLRVCGQTVSATNNQIHKADLARIRPASRLGLGGLTTTSSCSAGRRTAVQVPLVAGKGGRVSSS
jgi:hypothetical protein